MNQINARIQYKYDTEANWNKSTFISLAGETYVHKCDDEKIKLKFGDGINKVPDLPFVNVGLDEEPITGVTEVKIYTRQDGIHLRWKSPYQHSKYRKTVLVRSNTPYLWTFEEGSPENLQMIETTTPAYLISKEGQIDKTIFEGNDQDRAIEDIPGYCEYVDSDTMIEGETYKYKFIVYDKSNKKYESEEFSIQFTDSMIIHKNNFRFYVDGEQLSSPPANSYITKEYDGEEHTLVIKYYDADNDIELDGTDVAFIDGDNKYIDVVIEDLINPKFVEITPKNCCWEDGSTDAWKPFFWGLVPAQVTISISYPNIRKYIRLLKTDNGYETDKVKLNITTSSTKLTEQVWNMIQINYQQSDAEDSGPETIIRNDDYTVSIFFGYLHDPTKIRIFNISLDNSTDNFHISNSHESFIVKIPELSTSTWEEIANMKNPSDYFNIGDTKKITLDGQIGDYLTLNNQELNVYIVDFADDNKGIYFAGFKDMSNNNICLIDSKYGTDVYNTKSFALNSEDWATSTLREVLGSESKEVSESDNTLMKALPEEFRSKLKQMNVLYSYPSYDYDQGFVPTMTTDYITVPDLDELIYDNQFEYFGYNKDLKMNALTDNSPKCWITRGCSVYGKPYESQWEAASYIDENGEVVLTPNSNNLNISYGIVPIFLFGHNSEEDSN